MQVLLFLFQMHLKIIYFILKLFTKTKRQVFFLSRQTNEPSINYQYLIDFIQNKDASIGIKVSCRRAPEGLNKKMHSNEKIFSWKEIKEIVSYYFLLYKQMYFLASSKVILIDGYNILVSGLHHKKDTKIIQIWHALAAIKKFGYQTIDKQDGISFKMAKSLHLHENYDYVISGSDAMKDAFSEAFHISKEKILSIGTPYIDYLLKTKPNQYEAYENYPCLKNKKVILYCPTFRRNGKNVVDEIIKNIDLDKYCLIIRLHPLDVSNRPKSNLEGVLLNPKIEYVTLLKMADYVITDYSALMIEASIVLSNIFLYVYDYEQYEEENGLNINLFEELKECVFKDFHDLMACIENKQYNQKSLVSFREKYVTNLKGNSTEEIYDLIRGML
jgi:CDP-ribitol ribitolphosphotransferase